MFSDSELDLTVQVNAGEWAYNQRRTIYLEVLLLRLVRDEANIQEWFSADELAALRLPGLPPTPASIARKATAGKWRRKRDRSTKGQKFMYHVVSLPSRAFDALLARILDLPEIEGDPLAVPNLPATPPVQQREAAITAPPWVLPLMRLMKGAADGDIAAAWRELPKHVPAGVRLPSVEEAATVLVRWGLAGK